MGINCNIFSIFNSFASKPGLTSTDLLNQTGPVPTEKPFVKDYSPLG